ncbi:anaerobic ribonucleoside-triphosphate reductase activating protein [Elusimicrobium posterum]|uniref:anaerobic ribonucleoside-triphosphate reductase activating protein n=1 Tax=Elusimicrobium posterum TaxID=3116653 RepID=UPI003C751C5F
MQKKGVNVPGNFVQVSGVIKESIVDGPGYRYTVFTQGCPHRCPGCHNPQTFPLDGGAAVNINEFVEDIKQNPLLKGLTLSGGEPFLQAKTLALLAARVHEIGKDVIVYTGYTYEQLVEGANAENGWNELLAQTDYLIDGPFILEQRTLSLKFRGSTNQRIIDVKETQKTGNLVIKEF